MRYESCAGYIMANVNRSVLYTGVTSDLLKRVADHRARLDPRCFTARYRVDQLVHFEPFQDVRVAIEREKQIKGWTRAKNRAHRSTEPGVEGPLAGPRRVTCHSRGARPAVS